MLMKSAKKVLAVLLAVLTIFSFTAVFAGATEAPTEFVVLGDSIAAGSGILNADEACYGRIVANTNGYSYSNFARNGLTTKGLINFLNERTDIIEAVSQADIINISIGGNDFLQQNMALLIAKAAGGNYDNLDDIQKTLAVNFAEIIARLKELNPDATIIIQFLYNPRTDMLAKYYGMAVDRVNSTITDYLAENAGAFEIVDARAVMDGRPENVAADTIHPSALGNVVIAEAVLEKLYELGLGENTEPVVNVAGRDQVPFASQIIVALRDFFRKIKDLFSALFAG